MPAASPDTSLSTRPVDARDAALIEAACRSIERAERAPALAQLAEAAGLSPFHFQRLFKRATGVSPKQYASAHRAGRLKAALAEGARVTEAALDAGFDTPSVFHQQAPGLLGMQPRQYRDGGRDARIHFALGRCALGEVLVAETQRGVVAISLGDDAEALLRELQRRFPRAELVGGDAGFDARVARIVGFLEGHAPAPDLPLDIRGTAFQQQVWAALRRLPPGCTVTYAELAARIGQPRAVRAVASACAANTLAVAIPCHRVVRSDGGLGGYRWGIARKGALLAREATG